MRWYCWLRLVSHRHNRSLYTVLHGRRYLLDENSQLCPFPRVVRSVAFYRGKTNAREGGLISAARNHGRVPLEWKTSLEVCLRSLKLWSRHWKFYLIYSLTRWESFLLPLPFVVVLWELIGFSSRECSLVCSQFCHFFLFALKETLQWKMILFLFPVLKQAQEKMHYSNGLIRFSSVYTCFLNTWHVN